MSDHRHRILVGLAAFALICLVAVSLTRGSYSLGMGDLADLLGQDGGDEMVRNILFEIRMPRILLAVLCGMAMALSGTVLQVLTHTGQHMYGRNVVACQLVARAHAGEHQQLR